MYKLLLSTTFSTTMPSLTLFKIVTRKLRLFRGTPRKPLYLSLFLDPIFMYFCKCLELPPLRTHISGGSFLEVPTVWEVRKWQRSGFCWSTTWLRQNYQTLMLRTYWSNQRNRVKFTILNFFLTNEVSKLPSYLVMIFMFFTPKSPFILLCWVWVSPFYSVFLTKNSRFPFKRSTFFWHGRPAIIIFLFENSNFNKLKTWLLEEKKLKR